MKTPIVGDLRVCHVPLIAEHATSVDVPDIATAHTVYEALVSTLTMLVEHGTLADGGETIVQQFTEDGWKDVDLATAEDAPYSPETSARDRLEHVRHVLDRPVPKNSFYLNGFPTTYHAIAEFYDDELAIELAKVLRPELVDELS